MTLGAAVDLHCQSAQVGQLAHGADVIARCFQKPIVQKQGDDLSGLEVQLGVGGARHRDQVLRPVVVLDAVDVMHDDVFWKRNGARDFVHIPMLQDVTVSRSAAGVIGLVNQDVTVSRRIAATLPRFVFGATLGEQDLGVMTDAPSPWMADVFATFRSRELRHLRGLAAAALAQAGWSLPVRRRCHALAQFNESKVTHPKGGVIPQVVHLDKSWWPFAMARSPRNLFVAAALAAIDRCVKGACSLASIGVRELRFDARVARGMAQQVSRLSVAMVRPFRDWLLAAALADRGAHLSMIHLNDAIGG